MAEIAGIASPKNYNKEIICEDVDEGFILKKDYPQEMLDIIKRCCEDGELLNRIKKGSYWSQKRYDLEEYENMIKKL